VCRADNFHVPIVLKSGNPNHLETLEPVQACNGIVLTLSFGPHDQSGLVQKISLLPSFQPRTVQPVGCRYTDWVPSCEDVHKTSIRITYSSGNHLVTRQCAEQVTTGDMLHSLKGDGKGFED
jgi:hypothetical protein